MVMSFFVSDFECEWQVKGKEGREGKDVILPILVVEGLVAYSLKRSEISQVT